MRLRYADYVNNNSPCRFERERKRTQWAKESEEEKREKTLRVGFGRKIPLPRRAPPPTAAYDATSVQRLPARTHKVGVDYGGGFFFFFRAI